MNFRFTFCLSLFVFYVCYNYKLSPPSFAIYKKTMKSLLLFFVIQATCTRFALIANDLGLRVPLHITSFNIFTYLKIVLFCHVLFTNIPIPPTTTPGLFVKGLNTAFSRLGLFLNLFIHIHNHRELHLTNTNKLLQFNFNMYLDFILVCMSLIYDLLKLFNYEALLCASAFFSTIILTYRFYFIAQYFL